MTGLASQISRRRRRRLESFPGRAAPYRRYSPPPITRRRVMPPEPKRLIPREDLFKPYNLIRPANVVKLASRRLAEAVRSAPSRFAQETFVAPLKRAEKLVPRPGERLYGLAFKDPRRVITCLRRKMRREVLHALGIAGRRGLRGRGGGYVRRDTSEFSC